MIITSTPYRISFFGGGTDYPVWYREHGGSVLSTSINRYCHIHARFLPPFFEHSYRVVWSKTETCADVSEIQHPAVREAIRHVVFHNGLEVHHFGDLPARTGVGSSSSFAVGILHALYALKGQVKSKRELAEEAIYLEQTLLAENVGIQDQIAAAYGGLNKIEFDTEGRFTVHPVPVNENRIRDLERNLLLVYTGVSRTASEVASKKVKAIADKPDILKKMHSYVDDAIEILATDSDLRAFGELLHETWQLKSSISDAISNNEINQLYADCRAAGALGGKLLGAGGGGFFLLFVEEEKRQAVVETLRDYLVVPFRFERRGSHISLYEPEFYVPV